MYDKVKDYYEMELKDTRLYLDSKWGAVNRDSIVTGAIQRCLGVALFVQELENSIDFETIDNLYNEYREKFYEMR